MVVLPPIGFEPLPVPGLITEDEPFGKADLAAAFFMIFPREVVDFKQSLQLHFELDMRTCRVSTVYLLALLFLVLLDVFLDHFAIHRCQCVKVDSKWDAGSHTELEFVKVGAGGK